MLQNAPFFWSNTVTICVLSLIVLATAIATISLLLALYFRSRRREAAPQLVIFLAASLNWARGAWNPPTLACDHTYFCWQFPLIAVILVAQCAYLFLRFLHIERGDEEQVGEPREKGRETL